MYREVPPDDAPLCGPVWELPGAVTSYALHWEDEAPLIRRFLFRFVSGLRGQTPFLCGIALRRDDLFGWAAVAPIVLIGGLVGLVGVAGASVRIQRADAEETLTGWAVVGIGGSVEALDRAADLAAARCQYPRAREAILDGLLGATCVALEDADLPLGALDDIDLRVATCLFEEVVG